MKTFFVFLSRGIVSEYLRPHLNHMYQNVRERLGSVLINIFEADLRFVDGPEPECPRIKDMITEVVGKIEIMQVEDVPKIRQLCDGM